jgi:inosine-uridine nucleoside N-ribohydrolase
VDEIERNGGAEAKFAAAVARFQVGLYQGTGFGGGAIHDALAVGAAIDPSFPKVRTMLIDVETEGRIARGETVANRLGTVDHVVDRATIWRRWVWTKSNRMRRCPRASIPSAS